MRMNRRLIAWVPWLTLPVLAALWLTAMFMNLEACALDSSSTRLCGATVLGIIGIPLLIAGILGFVLGRQFGKREATRGMEHEFD